MTKCFKGRFMCLVVNVCVLRYRIIVIYFSSTLDSQINHNNVPMFRSNSHDTVNRGDNSGRSSKPLFTLWVPSLPFAFLFYEICILALLFSPETDIKAPLPTQCPPSQFHCGANICVDGVNVCDFSLDCPNGEDEAKCCEYPSYF